MGTAAVAQHAAYNMCSFFTQGLRGGSVCKGVRAIVARTFFLFSFVLGRYFLFVFLLRS